LLLGSRFVLCRIIYWLGVSLGDRVSGAHGSNAGQILNVARFKKSNPKKEHSIVKSEIMKSEIMKSEVMK
jgi:hypothetical protein